MIHPLLLITWYIRLIFYHCVFTLSILITIALNLWKKEEDPAKAEDSGVGIFLVVSTLSFVVFFALGPGSIPWMITSELFTQGPRPAAIAVATLVNWLANLLVGFTFPVMVTGLEAQGYKLVELIFLSKCTGMAWVLGTAHIQVAHPAGKLACRGRQPRHPVFCQLGTILVPFSESQTSLFGHPS